MKRLLAAAALLMTLATHNIYAQNFNVINGNGNSVVNGGGQRFARNHNQIIGNNNTLINGGSRFHPTQPVTVGHTSRFGHSVYPQYQSRRSGYRHYPVMPGTGCGHTVAYRQQPRLQAPRASNPLGIPINVNYNSVRGNANTVVNGGSTRAGDVAVDILGQIASGSAQRNGLNVNINRVRGNQNTVVNP